MSIYERDYYKEKQEKIERKIKKQNFIIWAIIIIVILGLVLSSLSF
ncbi:MAG: hypothetical protein KatS3mg095_0425 [Candidatus Parcubacteria bacterium]|nr:MAG: hypothetical protein KatS3mg095_0425 [Candidatus Parcubacteria bacterium]